MNIAILRRSGALPPLLVAALVLLLAAGGDQARLLLRYDRAGLAAGQWWRLLSGHFVHLGLEHALLNLAGLGLLWALFGRAWSPRQWLVITLCAIAAIDAGLWLWCSTVQWYVGSSGWLHGVFAAGILAGARDSRRESGLLGLALVAKLAWEQLHGALPLTQGGAVITQAHLFGAAGGLVGAALLLKWRKPL